MQPAHHDIVICGTGLAGLATALGLARGLAHGGLRPCLLGSKRDIPRLELGRHHPRVYAISPPAQQFLKRLGVWGLLDASRIAKVESMQVVGDAGGSVALHGWQRMQAELAWIVESDALEIALRQALKMFEVEWIEEPFAQLARGRDSATVITASGRTLPAQLVIGADGAHSAVRQAAGIASREHAYGQLGLVANLIADAPHLDTARQWFDHGDILALLPMPDGATHLPGTAQHTQVSMVWSMEEARARDLLALPHQAQAQRLQALLAGMTGNAPGAFCLHSDILSFPLTRLDSDMIAAHGQTGVALVGDAAHRVHPLAGQGLNLALGDVEQLIHVLREKPPLVPCGDASVLRRYRRLRAQPVWAMRTATDSLQRLFASDLPAVVWGRNLGMQCVEHLPWLKQRLIAAASRN